MSWPHHTVRVVTVGEDGSVMCVSGPGLAETGKRMKAKETVFPRMFLSKEADRLVRSFNSQTVRISQTVDRLPLAGTGVCTNGQEEHGGWQFCGWDEGGKD